PQPPAPEVTPPPKPPAPEVTPPPKPSGSLKITPSLKRPVRRGKRTRAGMRSQKAFRIPRAHETSHESNGRPLRKFMAQIAIDPEKYASFIREPALTLRRAGLTDQEAAVLDQGDWDRIYGLLTSDR